MSVCPAHQHLEPSLGLPPGHVTMIAMASLQSPVTPFTVARWRKCTVDPGLRPLTVALAFVVIGRLTHVTPPSRLYWNS